MPLTPDCEVVETPTILKFVFSLHMQPSRSVDVSVTSVQVKVSFPPYLYSLDLNGEIDDVAGVKAVAKGGVLTLKCKKKDKGMWEHGFDASRNPNFSPDDVDKRRDGAIVEREKAMNDMHEKARDKRCEEERIALRKQMDLESDERNTIDDKKDKEKKTAEEEVYRTFREMEIQKVKAQETKAMAQQGGKAVVVPSATKTFSFVTAKKTEDTAVAPAGGGGDIWSADEVPDGTAGKVTFDVDEDAIFDEDDIEEEEDDDDEEEEEDEDAENKRPPAPPGSSSSSSSFLSSSSSQILESGSDDLGGQGVFGGDGRSLPAPRASTRTTFKYTPRLFKTPMRESTVKQEQEFVAKNRPHLHNNGLLNKDALDISDVDPVWLKGRGDDLFRGGDILGAINAYSSAFEADKTMVKAVANRSACYLKMQEGARCVSDCDDALKLSSIPGNRAIIEQEGQGGIKLFWLKLFVRRGCARCMLGEFSDATDDCKKAWDLDPTNAELESDYMRMKRLADVDAMKKEGDACFGRGEVEPAIEKYNAAIAMDGRFVSAVSNRAGAYLAFGNYEDCISDCDAALRLLSGEEGSQGSGPIPPPGSDKRKEWVYKTVCRRSKAKSELGRFVEAIKDLEMALKFVPEGRQKVRDEIHDDIDTLKDCAKQAEKV